MTTLSLQDLKQSNEFLNIVLDTVTSAVFVLDEEVRLRAFNDSFKALFCKEESDFLGEKCGNAVGCAFAVAQDKECGETTHCDGCELRNAILATFAEKIPAYKEKLSRIFYINNVPRPKHFLFSTRSISYEGRDMALVVVDDVTTMEKQQEELARDLAAAGEVQRSLLPPKDLNPDNFETAWKFLPSHSIGGDIFNVLPLGDARLAVYMLDVCGHGAPAAMVALLASQAVHPNQGNGAGALPAQSPSSILYRLDRQFPLERFDKFFTMSYLTLDGNTGEISYSNAAHPPPLILRTNGDIDRLDKGGTIIGLGGYIPFEEGADRLRPGDRLFLLTDGIIEHHVTNEFFGLERVEDCLKESRRLPLQQAVDLLMDRLLAFGSGKPPEDDVSILALEFRPSPS